MNWTRVGRVYTISTLISGHCCILRTILNGFSFSSSMLVYRACTRASLCNPLLTFEASNVYGGMMNIDLVVLRVWRTDF